VAAPVFSIPAGTYSTTQTVAISDATAGATIYYTTNGATPTTSAAKYAGAITVSATETIRAIAVKTGSANSSVASATYTISNALPAPAFSVASGTYSSAQSVAISDTTSGTTIYYTTNGATPTTASSVYSGPVTVSATETIEAIAVKSGSATSAVASATYTISKTLPAPIFGVASGTYPSAQSVAISDTTSGATIYYTTNGAPPTTSSARYAGPITVSTTETIEAIAVASGYTNSSVALATYTIGSGVSAPAFSPAPGTYTSAMAVTISAPTSGTVIYYTADGSTPTSSSKQYGGPLWLTATQTIKAIAVKSGLPSSASTSATYTIARVLPTPTFSPATGIFTTTQTVTINDSTAGVAFYYTTNGSTPTTSSARYIGPITVAASETVKAIAVASGYTNSQAGSGVYTINSTLPLPTFSATTGIYVGKQTLTIRDTTAGTTIYYTTNGAAPTTASSMYTGPISVSSSITVKAIAVATGHQNSPVATTQITISGM
jgi:hypothetical protein